MVVRDIDEVYVVDFGKIIGYKVMKCFGSIFVFDYEMREVR